MMEIRQQLALGKLVSPLTGKVLMLDEGEQLVTEDRKEKFLCSMNVPILLKNKEEAEKYILGSERMVREYSTSVLRPPTWLHRLKLNIKEYLKALLDVGYSKDYRTSDSERAFAAIFAPDQNEGLYVAIGGGPTRHHPLFVNLNIGAFPNVDVVADAHDLPYADQSVDGIFCEAVLEHLKEPVRAVQEIHRVLKANAKAYATTPFIQGYHGYPNHFQNYTLSGQQSLFQRNGFEVIQSGVCVGPFCSLVDLVGVYIQEFWPSYFLKGLVFQVWRMMGLFIRKLDRKFAYHPSAFKVASSTYVLARKLL